MKAGRAIKMLNVSEDTLKRYREDGKIETSLRENGQYDYDHASVLRFREATEIVQGKSKVVIARKCFMYFRASNGSEKDTQLQEDKVLPWARNDCHKRGTKLSKHRFTDHRQAQKWDERYGLREMLEYVYDGKVDTIYMLGIDRIGFIDAGLLRFVLDMFGTKLRLMDEEFPEIADFKPTIEDFAAYGKVKAWYSKRSPSNPTDYLAMRLNRFSPTIERMLKEYKRYKLTQEYWELKTAYDLCKAGGVKHHKVLEMITKHTGLVI